MLGNLGGPELKIACSMFGTRYRLDPGGRLSSRVSSGTTGSTSLVCGAIPLVDARSSSRTVRNVVIAIQVRQIRL
jgi:hypothetical protein